MSKDKIQDQADLIYKSGIFYLVITRDIPEEKEYTTNSILGVDLGIQNVAVDSDREIFSGDKVEKSRRRYSRLKSVLQHVGTRSAKGKLKKMSGHERHFKKDTNHRISKHIISKVKKGTVKAVAIEDLQNIRTRPAR
jgi:putative transposase